MSVVLLLFFVDMISSAGTLSDGLIFAKEGSKLPRGKSICIFSYSMPARWSTICEHIVHVLMLDDHIV